MVPDSYGAAPQGQLDNLETVTRPTAPGGRPWYLPLPVRLPLAWPVPLTRSRATLRQRTYPHPAPRFRSS
jgi:hypothetical protein